MYLLSGVLALHEFPGFSGAREALSLALAVHG